MTEMYSLNQLSRKLDFPYQSLLARIRTGELIPDAITGRYFLFDAGRLPAIIDFLTQPSRTTTVKIEATQTSEKNAII